MADEAVADVAIQEDVLAELEWDPEVQVTEVGVTVEKGVVTLTGTVETAAGKMAAEQAASRVTGVRAVANEIIVKQLGGGPTDTEIATAAADALERNRAIPAERIDIEVTGGGRVTLRGQVDWQFQRADAADAIRHLAGVRTVTNLITVQPQTRATAWDIQSGIERAFLRHAQLGAEQIQVRVDGGHVTLTGTARSFAERRIAEETAWRAPGVTQVTNKIRVR
ncbi:BON domain-containing protein [Nitrolancea hollandica]|uniref:Osmotically inducible protein Y domain protein n=1 Tax=Nitrolancea hollandica Lb TaxID=1129897 RepID=I4EJG4_9BACT|nr:BON domain-containing protein [Nitrolancea hollandica]CCF84826.1 Osmotically inducible protein Y domain protein [Nitrolancea hollandica Lb]